MDHFKKPIELKFATQQEVSLSLYIKSIVHICTLLIKYVYQSIDSILSMMYSSK